MGIEGLDRDYHWDLYFFSLVTRLSGACGLFLGIQASGFRTG